VTTHTERKLRELVVAQMREFLVGATPTLPWWRQRQGVQSRGAEGMVGGRWMYLEMVPFGRICDSRNG